MYLQVPKDTIVFPAFQDLGKQLLHMNFSRTIVIFELSRKQILYERFYVDIENIWL